MSQLYPPEVGAAQTRVATFAHALADAGHDVTVIAQLPNHPHGRIFEGWRRRPFDVRTDAGVREVRVWIYTSATKTFLRRIAYYLSFAATASIAGIVTAVRRRPQVVFASSPPLFVFVAAWITAVAARAPLVLDVRDLWPDVGQALGELGPGRAYRLAQRLERFLYHRAARVTTVTRPFVDHVVAAGVDPAKVVLLPNGTLPGHFTPDRHDPDLRARLGLSPTDFVAGYLGNHGIAQGLGAVVDAAGLLDDRAAAAPEANTPDGLAPPSIRFLLVGEGPVRAALIAQARAIGTDRVTFVPEVGFDEVPEYMTACDVLLVPLRALELLESFVPSKLFDGMAAGRGIVLMLGGEARALLESTGAGWAIPPEDPAALADLLERLASDPATVAAAGLAGRAAACDRFDRAVQAQDLVGLLEDVAARRAPSPSP